MTRRWAAAVFIAVPLHYFGAMYGAFSRTIPHYFEIPPSATAHNPGPAWLIPTVLMTGLGQ